MLAIFSVHCRQRFKNEKKTKEKWGGDKEDEEKLEEENKKTVFILFVSSPHFCVPSQLHPPTLQSSKRSHTNLLSLKYRESRQTIFNSDALSSNA
jgi:hypothetical protein